MWGRLSRRFWVSSYQFPCGCSFPILEEREPIPLVDFSLDSIPDDCPAVWKLLEKGLTKGVFQLESRLGRQWTKRLKPENDEHVGALGALLRPGPLMSVDENNVSMTEHFCRRKNGEEEIEPFHPVYDKIVAATEGIIAYQESIMECGKQLAGFDLIKVDRLRKAVAKKSQQELSEVKKLFLEGAKELGVISEDQAQTIWGWIEKSGRYCFNKCVSAFTIIERDGSDPLTVESMYNIYHDKKFAERHGYLNLHKQWNEQGNYGYGLSMVGDECVPNIIEEITPAGIRAVFCVTLTNGLSISVTDNHKFPTPDGEMTLAELEKNRWKISPRLFVRTSDNRIEVVYIDNISLESIHEVYDVTMAAPHHNFVANEGIVTSNSHAISYGLIGYKTAYIKAHFPLAFYTAWLFQANKAQNPHEEMAELIEEAKLFDINVLPPLLINKERNFHLDGEKIRFGLCDIKGIGEKQLDKLFAAIDEVESLLGKPVEHWNWLEFLIYLSPRSSSNVITRLIQSGALSHFQPVEEIHAPPVSVLGGVDEERTGMVRELDVEIAF